jgi:hypothetical protein
MDVETMMSRFSKPIVRVAVVGGGYLAAVLIASAAVAINVAGTSGPDRQGASGMYAFGDSMLFLGVFGIAAIPPTGAALYFLRSWRGFWRPLSVVGLAIAGTGLAAAVLYLVGRGTVPGSTLQVWAGFSVLRILIAPLLGLAFFLAGLFAPTRPDRIALLIATSMEAVAFGAIALTWMLSAR